MTAEISAGMAERLAAGRPAGEVLAWSRGLVTPALRRAVTQLPESMRVIAEYHFGWRDEQGDPCAICCDFLVKDVGGAGTRRP